MVKLVDFSDILKKYVDNVELDDYVEEDGQVTGLLYLDGYAFCFSYDLYSHEFRITWDPEREENFILKTNTLYEADGEKEINNFFVEAECDSEYDDVIINLEYRTK